MKTAVIIGGGNGAGLAISLDLINRGYKAVILDRKEPESGALPEGSYTYQYLNLLDLDEEAVSAIAGKKDLEVLMITAGIGRVAEFEYFTTAEINNIMTINATSTIKLLRLFYDRINSGEDFYTGVMGSISGWMSSPMAAVYSASKAAVCRFVESVNIELEVSGKANRILNVSPASFKGSKFYGGANNLELLADLAGNITERIFKRETLYIPQYDETFKAVLERYHKDPHEYGLHSYKYKKDSGRAADKSRMTVGYLSGTFDLFHVGHLNLLRRAKENCDYLIVGVHNNGAWKGKETFIPLDQRKQIVAACKYVDRVVDSCPEDADAWDLWHYNKLFVGSDYKGTERFNRYEEYFKDKGVEIVYFPYTKSTSSTAIRNAIHKRAQEDEKK